MGRESKKALLILIRQFALYLSIFISSFFSFLIQPLIAKYLLSYWGGSSSVWIVSSVFFTVLLLLGYIGGYYLSKHTAYLKNQLILCFSLIVIWTSLYYIGFWKGAFLPFIDSNLASNYPILSILMYLLLSIGGIYLVYICNGILVQKEYLKSFNKEPYKLYSISNLGSLSGLLSYPLFFERFFDVTLNANIILCGFLLYLLLLFFLYYTSSNNSDKFEQIKDDLPKITTKNKVKWLWLSMLGTGILISTTSYITLGETSMPFLWVVLLCIYLLSMIIAFTGIIRHETVILSLVFLYFASLTLFISISIPWAKIIGITLNMFFALLIVNAYLYHLRPNKNSFGKYYLWLAGGGAIGSIFAGIIMPFYFVRYHEYSFLQTLLLLSLVLYAVTRIKYYKRSKMDLIFNNLFPVYISVTISLFTIIIVYTAISNLVESNVIYRDRNFYGLVKVIEKDNMRILVSEGTIHGLQMLTAEEVTRPTSYYSDSGPVGLSFDFLRKNNENLNIGVIGLGVGTISSYCKNNDSITYFEINPLMKKIATEYFTFLNNCSNSKIVMGDARISLEKEQNSKFDILLVDAFTGDNIPSHLLTEEAFALYKNKITPNGILLFHISNKYIDLEPLISGNTTTHNLNSIKLYKENDDTADEQSSASKWIFSSNTDVYKDLIEIENKTQRADLFISQNKTGTSKYKFTDTKSSILEFIRFKNTHKPKT